MKRIITAIGIILIIGIILFFSTFAPNNNTTSENSNDIEIETKDETKKNTLVSTMPDDNLMDNVMSGGPPKDGIPPIDNPKYTSVSENDYLNDFDQIFVYEADEGIFLYPQRILVWHEIVNDNIDGVNVAITYCPLTGSAICYLSDLNHPDNTYGTSGDLLNSNLVMYDRETDSYIPQILGQGISGTLNQTVIPTTPIHWTDWKDVKILYPYAKVLSKETGFFRDYSHDPYGTYLPDDENSYYYFGGPLFSVLNEDDTFSEKKSVIGVKAGNEVIAIDPFLLKDEKVHAFEIGGFSAIALYDESLKVVRVFNRSVNDNILEFKSVENGFVDQNGVFYNYKGHSENIELEPLTYFDVMWFAWYAYYPNTGVIK